MMLFQFRDISVHCKQPEKHDTMRCGWMPAQIYVFCTLSD